MYCIFIKNYIILYEQNQAKEMNKQDTIVVNVKKAKAKNV